MTKSPDTSSPALSPAPTSATQILELLLQQADDGAGTPPALRASLRAIIEAASEAGAARALHRIGLSDERASEDISDLRELLAAWRDAKSSAWKAVVDWAVRGLLALLLIGIAMKLGLGAWLR